MSESDQHPTQRSPTAGDLSVSFAQAIADLRSDMRQGLRELSSRLGKIEETLTISSTQQAVHKLQLEEIAARVVSSEARIRALETSEQARATREAIEKDKAAPKQYGIVVTALVTAVVTLISGSVGAWFLYSFATFVAKHPPGATP